MLLELLLVGSFGLFGTTGSLLRDFNIEQDTSLPQQHIVKIHDKKIKEGRKSKTRYKIIVDDWIVSDELRTIEVSRHFYHSVLPSDYVEMTQHQGKLGYRFVSRVEKVIFKE